MSSHHRRRPARRRRRALLAAVCLFSAVALPSTAVAAEVVLPYGSPGWRYKQVTTTTLPTGFSTFAFNDASYAIGTAPFSNGTCDGAPIGTPWEEGTAMLVRKQFTLGPSASGLVVALAIDNDLRVWVNGIEVGTAAHDGCAVQGDPTFPVPDGALREGTNVIAVQALDRGGLTHFDAQITAWNDGCTVRGAPDVPGQRLTINAIPDNAVLCGTAGHDRIVGGSFGEVLLGAGGNDTLIGNGDEDTLLGGAGNDSLDGGIAGDVMRGEAGVDTVTYATRSATNPVTAVLDGTATSGGTLDGNADLAATDVENLTGGRGADTLTGNAARNTVTGGLGADSLLGLGGNDTLKAKDGVVDTAVDCDGPGSVAGTADKAQTDPGEPTTGCETITN